MLETLKQSLQKASVVKRGPYTYFQYPLTDGAPGIDPGFLKEICEEIIRITDIHDVDLILTMEAMGIHIATMISALTNIPFNIIRKKPRYLPQEIILDQQTGYGHGKMYLNAVTGGQKILVVDAVISTGGTLIAVLNALKKVGVIVTDAICIIERGNGKQNVKRETGIEVKTLVTIDVTEAGVQILHDYYTP